MEAYYELTNGELIEMPPESDENVMIARAMDRALSNLVGFQRVRTHQLAIEMPGQPKNRFPDMYGITARTFGTVKGIWTICHSFRYASADVGGGGGQPWGREPSARLY